MLINHVMSNDVQSSIFNDIINYFEKYGKHKYIKSIKPIENADVYHYHRPNLENKLEEKSLVTVHHDLNELDGWLNINNFLDRYKETKKIICLNTNQKKYLEKININNTVVIPHGYNKDYLLQKKEIKEDKNKMTLGFFSKRYPRKVKGEAYLFELSKRLDPTKIEFILVGENRSFETKFLRNFGFDVRLYESIPYSTLCSLYQEIDMLLMLSNFEGGPANIPEAVYTRTPLLSKNIGLVTDYISEENGLIIEGDLTKDLNKINKLIENDFYELKELKKKCILKEYNNLFSWEEVISLYEKEYEKIVGDK